ncbi:FAD-dependent oxidoreductase [Paenibacillus sp. MMS20-IR301]|uniref:NAD(P)/FAD-dependent oxidoreductase n=1 Tax=Paenibacillus sp. MMS20-IR301 TaxID=2895946 RepID=UPI0028E549B2|nr:FAD-dependent oxidoreductase [Paenibacillus sp. MMS20-IR301]WNS46579.1 FAD-dependent oxidoreductase [Paenibacillus sp. MMS20-IR301]
MKLISGQLPWANTLPHPPVYPVLEGDTACDCLIVGGGMGGAMMSYRMSLTGADTVIIDKRSVAGGSSHANTGLLQIANDKSLTSCMNTFGEENGVLFYKLCQRGLQAILDLPEKLEIDPQIIPRSSLLYASSLEDVPALKLEQENLASHGFDSELWNEEKIRSHYSFSRPAALYSRGDAETNPFRTVHSLIHKAHSGGVRVYAHTEALSYEYRTDGVICHTRHGRIFAKNVVFAMGYETQEMKKDRGAELINTYAVMTKPLRSMPKWHEQSLIWETARPYLYFRTTPDGRIIAGGKDEQLTDPDRREVRVLSQSQRLLEELVALFPELQGIEAEYSWGAVFGSTRDGLPYMGPHPEYPHCYFIEGYGGNGTVYSMIAAELLSDTLAGRHRPELELFSLTRTAKPSPSPAIQG